MTVTNNVIVGDCAALPPAEQVVEVVSNGNNIESPLDTCGFDQTTDQVNVSTQALNLGPLQNNSGPTETQALRSPSIAINQIPEADCEVNTDQRGQPRPAGTPPDCDVGSFEVQPEL
jgi:hypothetical protein